MAIRGLLGLALVAATWIPVAEGRAAAASPSLLLYGPDGPDFALEDRALASFNLQGGVRSHSPRLRHMSAVLDGVPEITIVGAIGEACPGGAVTAASFEAELETELTNVLYVRQDESTVSLERLAAMLPCVGEPLAGENIARASFLQGIALAYVERNDEALEAFRQALVVYPQLDWEARFPPGPELVFREAILAALRSEKAKLSVAEHVGEVAQVWIDGVPISAGGETSVAAGRHLLQWRLDGGAFETRLLAVEGGTQVAVFGRVDVAYAAITGVGCEPCLATAAAALTRLADEAGVAQVHLVELGVVDMLHTFAVDGERWERTDEGAVARRVRNGRLRNVGKVTLAAGGALALVGTIVGVAGYANATGLVDEATQLDTQAQFDENSNRYANARIQSYLGFTLAGVGGGALLVGLPLSGAGRQPSATGGADRGRSAVETRLLVSPTGIGVAGRF
jgi:hypothetical protein